MTNSQTSRLAVIAVIAASLLAVGVVTAISVVKQADAQLTVDLGGLRNRLSQSASSTTTQTATAGGAGACTTCIASNTATTTQSNTATQSNSISVTVD